MFHVPTPSDFRGLLCRRLPLLEQRRQQRLLFRDARGGEFLIGGARLGRGLFRQFEQVGTDGGNFLIELGESRFVGHGISPLCLA